MLKADATRIAWFLSLQRISHFPKYFMAPPTFQQRGRKSVASNLDVTPGQGLSSHSERMAPAQRNGFPALAVPMLQQATSPVNGFDRMTILRLITEAGSLLPAGAARSRELWNSPRFVTAGQTLDGPSRRQEAARHQSSGPPRNRGPMRLRRGQKPGPVQPFRPSPPFSLLSNLRRHQALPRNINRRRRTMMEPHRVVSLNATDRPSRPYTSMVRRLGGGQYNI
jgi:hypothetical protein